jgi:hypothetical protein
VYKLQPIQQLSYSRFIRLQRCLLSGARLELDFPHASWKPRRSKIIGDVLHREMELLFRTLKDDRFTGEQMRRQFNDLLSSMERELHLPNSTLRTWPEIGQIYGSISAIARTGAFSSTKELTPELDLATKDELLVGRLDLLIENVQGQFEIIDYKSNLFEEDEYLSEKEDQLYFYAYLVEENRARYPEHLTLMSKELKLRAVQPLPDRSHAIGLQMREMLNHYNSLVVSSVEQAVPVSPSPHACRYCVRRMHCNAFWESAPRMAMGRSSQCVIAEQSSSFFEPRLGGTVIPLKNLRGSINCADSSISRVRPADLGLENAPGQTLMILDASTDDKSAHLYANERTFISVVNRHDNA